MTPQGRESTHESPPRAPTGRRERKKQETRDRLHRAAQDLFAKQGYHETRIAEIAEAADVSESTFFRYFESKEGVALEGLRRRTHVLLEAVCARPIHESPIEACLAVNASPETARLHPGPDEAHEFKLMATTPALVPSAVAMSGRLLNALAADVARRLGEPVGSIRVRIQAHALNMVNRAVIEVWLSDPERVDMQAVAREALLELKRGF